MSDEFERVALVTGSSRGIGRGVLDALASSNHRCIVHYRRDTQQAEATLASLRSRGVPADMLAADLGDPAAVDSLCDEIDRRFGRLDVLVASAAATRFGSLLDSKAHHVDRTMRTVVGSFVQLVARLSPMMLDQGRIVAISGLDARFAQSGHGLLGAAKAALESLVRSMAVELAPQGCTVNAVIPGAIDTESLQLYFRGDDGALDAMIAGTPAGRLGTVDDVAGLVLYLCSPAASFLTGQTIVIDGGASAEGGRWSLFRELWTTPRDTR